MFHREKRLHRASLDLHNLAGVVALPFHFVITLSGLIIFINIYFPQAPTLAYAEANNPRDAFFEEGYGRYSRKPAGVAGSEPARLDVMLRQAKARWMGGQPFFVRVWHPGDAASFVEVRRSYASQVTMNLDQVYFDAATGEVLQRFEAAQVMSAQRFIAGMHFIQFDHWPLRWLYFVLGLSGCVMIATGYIFWLEARRKQHAKLGWPGVRIVEGLIPILFQRVIKRLILFSRKGGREEGMTVYRKSFPEGTALLVHRLIEGSKDPNVLKRAQAVYCRAAFDLPLDQIAGLTGLAVSTIRRLHSEFLRFGMEIFDLSGRGGRRRQLMAPEEEVAFLQPFIEAGDAGGLLEVGKVHEALCERTGRRIHRSVTYKLLHRHDWRKIIPRSRHPKADQAAQVVFKKTGRTL